MTPPDARAPDGSRSVAAARAAAVGAAVVTLLVFLPALQNGFVNWDDEQNFVLNAQYRGLGPSQLGWMFTTFHMGPYQPLSWLTLGLDYTLWGMHPWGYHLTSVLLHAVNAGLLCVLIARLVRRAAPIPGPRLAGAAAIGALFWAAHPLRVESVAWVTERRDVLSGTFTLLALLAYVARPLATRPAVLVLAALALLAKASAMVLPALLLVLDVYPLRRLGGAVGWTSAAARRVLVEKVPLTALCVVAGVLAIVGQRTAGALSTLDVATPGARVGTFLYQVGHYLRTTIAPIGLQPVYEIPRAIGPLYPEAIAGGATLVLLLAASWMLRRRWPVVAVAVAVYLIGFGPTNGLVQAGAQIAADRYTYLPALAWAGLIAAAIAWPPSGGGIRLAAGALAVAALVPLTVRQVGYWRDSVTLWERGLALAPDSALVHQWLGRAYMDVDRNDDMIALYDRWLADQPGNGRGWSDYGALLTNAGMFERAQPALDKAIAAGDTLPTTYYARALIRDRSGDAAGALADYTESLRRDPDQGFAYHNRGLIRRKSGDLAGAIADFDRALTYEGVRTAPIAYSVYGNYGLMLADAGRLDDATQALRTALTLAPAEARPRIEQLVSKIESRR